MTDEDISLSVDRALCMAAAADDNDEMMRALLDGVADVHAG